MHGPEHGYDNAIIARDPRPQLADEDRTHMPAHPITLRSGLVACVDPAYLPDDLVEDLAARNAIVVARASAAAAVVHLDDEERVTHIGRPSGPPLQVGAEVADLGARRREHARARLHGAIASAVAMSPLVALVPPVIRVG